MKQKITAALHSLRGRNKKKRLSIKQRFFILISIMTIGFTLVGLVSYTHSRTLVDSMEQMYKEHLQNVVRSEKMMIAFKQSELFLERTLDSKGIDEATGHVNSYMRYISDVRVQLQSVIQSGNGQFVAEHSDDIEMALFDLELKAAQMKTHIENGKLEEVKAKMEAEIRPIEKKTYEHMLNIEQSSLKAAEQIYMEKQSDAAEGQITNIMLMVVIGIACVWMGVATMRAIRKPINKLQHLMARAADGDLSAVSHDTGTDELGRLAVSYNEMMQGLQQIIQLIQKSTAQLMENVSVVAEYSVQSHQGAEQTSAAMKRTDESAKQQQISVAETLKAMEDMANSIQHIVHATGEVTDITHEAGQHTEHGAVTIERAVGDMVHIHEAMNSAMNTVHELQNHSKQIVHIITIIQQISSQTSLLAINASIEAARAGEHGRGFSVVADEVRQLAEQSGIALQQISNMITSIQRDTSQMAGVMSDVATKTKVGQETARAAGVMFKQLHQYINQIVVQTESVAGSIQEMSAGTEEITASTSEMASLSEHSVQEVQLVTKMTASQLDNMSQISSILDELYEMAFGLENQVQKFRLGEVQHNKKTQ